MVHAWPSSFSRVPPVVSAAAAEAERSAGKRIVTRRLLHPFQIKLIAHRVVGSRAAPSSNQSEMSKGLLNRCNVLCGTWIFYVGCTGWLDAEHFFAVRDPSALGHEAVLTRDPLLDLLIGHVRPM